MNTAEFERSDSRLAGLMLRCAGEGIEAVIVVVEPFPPHAQPEVRLRTPAGEGRFTGSVIPTGAGIRLPREAAALITRAPEGRSVDIRIAADGESFGGTVGLTGLSKALGWLTAECVQK
ncbi:MAG TPA: hypothetical protein VFF88_07910 [Methylocella sp.]|nr:hypothetical protein [Methylocella sp.]